MESTAAEKLSSSDHSVVIKGRQPSNKGKRPSSPSISKDDEEVAECLMLLAKGICPRVESQINRQRKRTKLTLSNQRLSEMDARKVDGYRAHECKTCYRTFPSGQALGGHQTSHKKLKLAPPENRETSLVVFVNSDEGGEDAQIDTKNILAPVPLQMIPGNGKAKSHECVVCGEKFLSGQALGGHMGRHRTTTITQPLLSKKPFAFFPSSSQIMPNTDSSEDAENLSEGLLLLDLNLPAPEFNHRDSDSDCELASASTWFNF